MSKVAEVVGCAGCPMARLYPNNTFVAPKIGNGKRLIIAEAPGEEEAIRGEPLVGGAGKWFDIMASKAGLRRADLTLANCIQCRPPDNVFPTDPEARLYITKQEGQQAVAQCFKNHLEPILKGTKWQIINLLGSKPLQIVGGKYEGIDHWQGSPIAIPILGEKPIAVPTFHPAYIMRDQKMLPKAINDLTKGTILPPEYYNLRPTLEECGAFSADVLAFDIESNIKTGEITMVGFCSKDYHVIVMPFRGPYVSEIRRIFAAAKEVVGQNLIQFDLPKLRDNGIHLGNDCVIWDTMLLQHLCFPQFPHDLEFIGSQFSNKPAWKEDNRGGEGYWEHRCARDVDITWVAWKQLVPLCKQNNLLDLYHTVQVPMAMICSLMHKTGFKIDPNRIGVVRDKFEEESKALEQQLPEHLRTRRVEVKKRQLAPPGTLGKSGKPVKYIHVPAFENEIPWRSPKQKQSFLYDELKLPVQKSEKGAITTGKEALERLYNKTKNPAIKAIKRLNQIDEVLTTFAKKEMHTVGRMHPHFNVHGTASGRLSSSDPNLQNIPSSARFIYVPSGPDWCIVDCDYSQIENRLTAYLAGDTQRLVRFDSIPGYSEHKYACSIFLGIPYDEVVKESGADSPYVKAKKIVHGTNFGEGYRKIAKQNDLVPSEVRKLHETWKAAIRESIAWQERNAERARREGFLSNAFKRRRWFYTASTFTEAQSFLPQSTAADIIFRAMIALMYERIGWPVELALRAASVVAPIPDLCRLLIQVHDSLVFECHVSQVHELSATLKRVMEQPWPELGGFSIPISIKVGEPGASWGECEEGD